MSLQKQFDGKRWSHSIGSQGVARDMINGITDPQFWKQFRQCHYETLPWATMSLRPCRRNGQLSGGLEFRVTVYEGRSEGQAEAPSDPGVLTPADRTWHRRWRPRWKHQQVVDSISRCVTGARHMHHLVRRINHLARAIDRIGPAKQEAWITQDFGDDLWDEKTERYLADGRPIMYADMTFSDVDYWNQWLQKHTEISNG